MTTLNQVTVSPTAVEDNAIAAAAATSKEGYTCEAINTKAKQADGTYKTYEAKLAVPRTAEQVKAFIAAASDSLASFYAQCAELGLSSKARNHLIAGRLDASEVITAESTLDAQEEALLARGQQGEALALYRAIQTAIVAHAKANGLNEKGCIILAKLISSTQALSLAKTSHKTRVMGFLDSYAESLSESDLVAQATQLQKLTDAASEEDDAQDDF